MDVGSGMEETPRMTVSNEVRAISRGSADGEGAVAVKGKDGYQAHGSGQAKDGRAGKDRKHARAHSGDADASGKWVQEDE